MDNKDYTNQLFNELRATREQLLEARIALVRMEAWLEIGEREKFGPPMYAAGALKELRTWREQVGFSKKVEASP